MKSKRHSFRFFVFVLSFVFLFVPKLEAKEGTYYVIGHAGAGDPFWAVLKKGVDDAGKQFGVQAIFQGPTERNIPAQVNMARSAIRAKAAGIAISISDPNAISAVIQEAKAQGVPVVAFNAREPKDYKKAIPYLAYIGMDEYEAGKNLAKFMSKDIKAKGVVLIAHHEPGHVGHAARAKGIKEVLTSQQNAQIFELDITQDPTKAISVIRAFMKKHPETQAIFTLGPLGAKPAIKVLEEEHLQSKVHLASFDLDESTVGAIKSGLMDATVDQQQYLQGYMSVTELFLFTKFKLEPSNYDTGRGLVTKDNVKDVETLVKNGYR